MKRFAAVRVGNLGKIQSDNSLNRGRRAAQLRRVVSEVLEQRTLMCADVTQSETDELFAGLSGPGPNDHDAAWYKPVASADGASDASASGDATWTTNAAGLPLLTQRADGQGLKIFLDFDGYGTDTPYDDDGNSSTFNAAEQKVIYDTWRDICSFYSMLNVNVTTVQPPTGGSNPVFVWQRISNSISGGAAYVGWLTNDSSQGWTGSENARSRHSGIAHEIGHQLGLSHQSEYDMYGTKTDEYSDGFSKRDVPVMGVDFVENIRGWFYGRNSDNPANLVDDLQSMANTVKGRVSGDGYRPDDFGNTMATAYTLPGSGMTSGIIERRTDADFFRFTVSTAGGYELSALPTFESAASPKIELMDSSGNVIAGRDDADQRNWNYNEQEISLNLQPGTYYLRVAGGADQSEQGEYLVTAAPLLGGDWASTDVGGSTMYRGGTAAYDPSTGVLTQVGGGTDIWNNSDQFRFTYTTLNGDGSITARLDSLDNVEFHTKGGVMIRQSLNANSAMIFMGLKPSGVTDPIGRSSAGANAFNAGPNNTTTNKWLRITRVGNTFTSYLSADGLSWSVIGTQTIAMNGPVYIGLATTAHNSRAQAYSTFSNIALTGNLGSTAPTYNSSLASPTIASITPASGASTGINLNWSAVANAAGYLVERSVDGVTYATAASLGAGILSYLDSGLFGSMRYFYRVSAVAADSSKSAPSVPGTTINKPAAPTNPASSYAKPFITPSTTQIYLNWADTQGDEGYKVERSSNGGSTWTTIATTPANATGYNDSGLTANSSYVYRITPVTTIGDGVAPSFLINAVTQLAAPTNFHFTTINSTSVALAWNDSTSETGYRLQRSTDRSSWTTIRTLGAGTTSTTDTGLTAVTGYYYRLVAFNAQIDSGESVIFAATPSATALPAPWSSGDIGNVTGQGATGTNGSTWTMYGSGDDIWNTSDAFQFAQRGAVGDSSMTVRVVSLDKTDDHAKAGIMFRSSNAANSPWAMIMYSPQNSVEFNYRTSSGAAAQQVSIKMNVNAPVYLRLVRTGNVFTASYSTDNANWTTLGSQTIAMPTSALMGFAVTSHNTQKLTKAVFDTVSTTGGAVVNTAPTIVTPAAATPSPVTGTTTNLSVSATDDGPSSALTYTWVVAGKPATATAPTFSINGTNAAANTTATFYAPGSYLFKVTVTDAGGLTTTSQVIVLVSAVATSMTINENPAPVAPGTSVPFTVTLKDQFGNTMAGSAGGWSTTAGSITNSGVWTAPADAGVATITATSGSMTATNTVQTNLVVTADTYEFDAAKPQVSFTFNGDLGTSLDASDVVIQRIAADGTTVLETIPASSLGATFDTTSNAAQITFTGLTNGVLPDGNYRAVFQQGTVSSSGILLGDDATVDFFVMAGDIDRDRDVDFSDLLTLAKNYGGAGTHSYSQGNLDYSADGVVGFSDLLILAKAYGSTLAAPTTTASASLVAAADTSTTKLTRNRVAQQVL